MIAKWLAYFRPPVIDPKLLRNLRPLVHDANCIFNDATQKTNWIISNYRAWHPGANPDELKKAVTAILEGRT